MFLLPPAPVGRAWFCLEIRISGVCSNGVEKNPTSAPRFWCFLQV